MNTHNIPFSIEKGKVHIIIPVCGQGFFCLGLKNEFETAMVTEPSAFEPQKFYYKVLVKYYRSQL